MNNIIERVWTQRGLLKVEDLRGSAFTTEAGGHTFQIRSDEAMSGTVSGSFIRPDHATVAITGSLSGNIASVTLPETCYAIPGRFALVIFLTNSGVKTAIYACVGNIGRSSTDTIVDPGTIIPSIADLIAQIQAAVASIPADYSSLWTSLAPVFSTEKTYSAGEFVTYNGALYRFTSTTHTGTWNADHVLVVSAGPEIEDTLEQLNQLSASEGYYVYNGGVKVSLSASSAAPAVIRNGNTLTLDGTFGAANNYYVSLSNPKPERGSAKSTFRSWPKYVALIDGHTYRATLTLVSGSYTLAEGGTIDVDLIDETGADASVTLANSKTIFKWSGNPGALAFHSTGGNSFNNAVFRYTIQDITDGDLSDVGTVIKQSEHDIYYVPDFTNSGYNVTGPVIEPDTHRIGPSDFIFCKKDDVIRIRHSTDMQHVWRYWKGTLANNTMLSIGGTWKTTDEEIVCPVDGFFAIKYADAEDNTKVIRVEDFDGGVNVISVDFLREIQKFTTPSTKGIAYSWWTNNRAIDSYGTLFFGYISKENMCGVGARYPDGTIRIHDLFRSEDCDDHNAPSVIILTISGEEYVCVIGSTGHNTDSKINVYVADEPNTIDCTFTDRTHTITSPSGYTIQNSYSQAYFDSTESKIYDFFRIKQINNSDSSYRMIWMCAISADYGVTWSIYRVFTISRNGTLFYMYSCDTTQNTWLKQIVLQPNTTNSIIDPIRAGFVNPKTLNLLDAYGESIGKPMTLMVDGELAYDPEHYTIADYDDFTEIVPPDNNHRFRILDVLPSSGLYFLYTKSVEDVENVHNITDWILYRYKNGVTTEIGHLGLPFFVGSCYVTGANFIGDSDHIIYSKTETSEKDGPHTLHKVTLDSNNQIVSDDVIMYSSDLIARPMRYDSGSIMYLKGAYREGAGTRYLTWHLGIGFMIPQ